MATASTPAASGSVSAAARALGDHARRAPAARGRRRDLAMAPPLLPFRSAAAL